MAGTNVAPITNPTGAWQIWNYNDIYTGPTGTGSYVPKVGDEVHQIVDSVLTYYTVLAVDTTTSLSTLAVVTESTSDGSFPQNELYGVGPGTQADTYLVYVDKRVSPHRLSVDARLGVAGSLTAYCKIFTGIDLTDTGTVISAVYDTSGTYVSENIPLELVGTWQGQTLASNTSIKTVQQAYTNADLTDGETVTAVLYSQDGYAVSKRQLLVVNTGFIRSLNASSKEVIDIALETPFLAAANSTIINYPVNVPINAMNLTGVVTYSDGSTLELAVDGTRFSVEGLDAYAPTIVGQQVPITLKYQLQAGEVSYGVTGTSVDHISRTFTVVTQPVSGSVSVQLYCYPYWISGTAGYGLKWFLYNLDRSVLYNVTPQVTIDTAVATFAPLTYGTKQTLRVYVNLQQVNAIYPNFFHVQYVDITLNNAGSFRPAHNALPDWLVAQTSGTLPMYGQGVYATFYAASSNSNTVKLSGDFTTYATWLAAYYGNTYALYNPQSETKAPDPTHFALVIGATRVEYPISQWNASLTFNQTLTNNDTIYLEFFKRTTQSDLQLSKAGMGLWQVDLVGNYI